MLWFGLLPFVSLLSPFLILTPKQAAFKLGFIRSACCGVEGPIMASNSPAASAEAQGSGRGITVTVVDKGGKKLFHLAFQSESMPLLDNLSLNRWSAIGLTDRHNVSV